MPSTIYAQSIDKQRVVIAGKSKTRITEMILFVLNKIGRKIDVSSSFSEQIADAATIIVEANGDPSTLKQYQPHILILSEIPSSEREAWFDLADASPKSGGIFYDDTNETANQIAKKERADVTIIPFSIPKYEMNNGHAVLISSTNEKFQTQLTTSEDLKSSNAAKEFLKKIGVTSSQFYKAIIEFK